MTGRAFSQRAVALPRRGGGDRMRFVRVPELGPPPFAPARAPFHLTFLLPPALTLGVNIGIQHPCLHQCLLRIEPHRGRDYIVRITGPSREKCFDQASRYLRVAARGHIATGSALQISAVLVTPARVCSGRDTWTIIVGADVACAPTGLGADIPSKGEEHEQS